MAFEMTSSTLQATTNSATGTVAVVDPDNFNCHRFLVTSTDTLTLNIEGSPDGSDWYILGTQTGVAATTKKDVLILDRPWEHLRVDWENNGGNVTVKLIQLYDRTETTV